MDIKKNLIIKMAKSNKTNKVTAKDILMENLKFLSPFAYASGTAGREKQTQTNGVFAASGGLAALADNQRMFQEYRHTLTELTLASVQAGKGIDASQSDIINNLEEKFMVSFMSPVLTVGDLVSYMGKTLNIELEKQYQDKTLAELSAKGASKKEKKYAEYIMGTLSGEAGVLEYAGVSTAAPEIAEFRRRSLLMEQLKLEQRVAKKTK